MKNKRIAIVHDFLIYMGGAEKVLEALIETYPEAPVYTLLYDESKMSSVINAAEVRTSFLQKLPRFLRRRHRWLLPFFAPAIESLDLRDFDLVISSSSAWSKGIVTRLHTEHVAYIHSPMRYVWDENEKYLKRSTGKYGFVARLILSYLRVWDFQAASRPDRIISNSLYTQDRVEKYYRKSSEVVYPPVSLESGISEAQSDNPRKDFVMLTRLSAYKNVDLAIEVCNKLNLRLHIIGEGPERSKLQSGSGDNIIFHGWCSEDEKLTLLKGARASLVMAEDDFGISAVESLACGTPVVGLGRGGLVEIIRDGQDGILFEYPTVEVAADGFRRFLSVETTFDHDLIRDRAKNFSKERFVAGMKELTNA